jgi:phospholipid/cholesterol/gamma-HCH transport system substrate-binding protein
LKISKEFKVGLITVLAIGFLIVGINFLKGHSFFGGDDQYTAYFPNSGNLAPANSVYVNGVIIGKVLSVEYQPQGSVKRKVKVVFTIQDDDIRIPRTSVVEIGGPDLLSKGVMLSLGTDLSKGYYKPGEAIEGVVAVDIISQVKEYADPISQKIQVLLSSVDETINSLNSFWDTTATSEIEQSMQEVKIAIRRFGNVAVELEDLVASEKQTLGRIFSNVESITNNLKQSNTEIQKIVGNTRKITDELVTVDYKGTVESARQTLDKFNKMLEDVNSGKGSLGKLVHDEKLYNELVNTNKEMQELVDDITMHPERYIHFSVFGAKTKGAKFTPAEEKKLRTLIDTIPQ